MQERQGQREWWPMTTGGQDEKISPAVRERFSVRWVASSLCGSIESSQARTGKIAKPETRGGPYAPVFYQDDTGVSGPLRAMQAAPNRFVFAPPAPKANAPPRHSFIPFQKIQGIFARAVVLKRHGFSRADKSY
jgi:hypothetical protein